MPHWLRLSRQGDTFTTEYSADGVNWAPITTPDAVTAPAVQLTMSDPVYVGLMVNANHDDATPCTATFSNVSVTGGIPSAPFSGSEDIGITTNSPAPLYAGLEDTAGNVGLVYHPDGPESVRGPMDGMVYCP